MSDFLANNGLFGTGREIIHLIIQADNIIDNWINFH